MTPHGCPTKNFRHNRMRIPHDTLAMAKNLETIKKVGFDYYTRPSRRQLQ